MRLTALDFAKIKKKTARESQNFSNKFFFITTFHGFSISRNGLWQINMNSKEFQSTVESEHMESNHQYLFFYLLFLIRDDSKTDCDTRKLSRITLDKKGCDK